MGLVSSDVHPGPRALDLRPGACSWSHGACRWCSRWGVDWAPWAVGAGVRREGIVILKQNSLFCSLETRQVLEFSRPPCVSEQGWGCPGGGTAGAGPWGAAGLSRTHARCPSLCLHHGIRQTRTHVEGTSAGPHVATPAPAPLTFCGHGRHVAHATFLHGPLRGSPAPDRVGPSCPRRSCSPAHTRRREILL